MRMIKRLFQSVRGLFLSGTYGIFRWMGTYKIIFFFWILKTIQVLYEQNKSIETIQRHESDAVVASMSMDEILVNESFL